MKKHSHYFKHCPYEYVDVYRVLELFGVENPEIAHAVKKLLVAGGRGHKCIKKDIQEAIDSLERWKDMREEDLAATITITTNYDNSCTISQSEISSIEPIFVTMNETTQKVDDCFLTYKDFDVSC